MSGAMQAQQPARPAQAGTKGRLVLAFVIGAACFGGWVVTFCAPWPAATSILWSMACTAAGTTLGFLFGVPRLSNDPGQPRPAVAHPNLDRISEWLTGLVVGASLVEAKAVPPWVWGMAEKLARALVGPGANADTFLASAQAFAAAVIVYYFVMGVIGGYMVTRLLLAALRSDDAAHRADAE